MREVSGALSCALGASVLAAVTVVGVAAPAEAATRTCFGVKATIVGTDGDDVIRGTAGPDVIVALRGKDRVLGRGGEDTVCAGVGADEILGGGGADALSGGHGDDRSFGGDGRDGFFGGMGDDQHFGGSGDDSFPSEPGDEQVVGGPGGDIAVPWSTGADGGDHDNISMGVGNDWVDVSSVAGGTTIDAGAGDDRVEVHSGEGAPLSLAGGLGTDDLSLWLGESPDELRLDQSADRFEWGAVTGRFSGWDEVFLHGEYDLDYTGHEGNDLVTVFGHGSVTASMLGGDDGLWGPFGAAGPYHLDGGEGDDDLVSGDGDDVLLGGPGSDFLDGLGGDDLLDGGTGAERFLSGGPGTDTAEDPDDDPEQADCVSIEIGFCADPPPAP